MVYDAVLNTTLVQNIYAHFHAVVIIRFLYRVLKNEYMPKT